jgi:hypothetical protein
MQMGNRQLQPFAFRVKFIQRYAMVQITAPHRLAHFHLALLNGAQLLD